jgi:hypothetical protein
MLLSVDACLPRRVFAAVFRATVSAFGKETVIMNRVSRKKRCLASNSYVAAGFLMVKILLTTAKAMTFLKVKTLKTLKIEAGVAQGCHCSTTINSHSGLV